jgi:hypothetical protein
MARAGSRSDCVPEDAAKAGRFAADKLNQRVGK